MSKKIYLKKQNGKQWRLRQDIICCDSFLMTRDNISKCFIKRLFGLVQLPQDVTFKIVRPIRIESAFIKLTVYDDRLKKEKIIFIGQINKSYTEHYSSAIDSSGKKIRNGRQWWIAETNKKHFNKGTQNA